MPISEKIISKCIIKPSSSTPDSLRSHKLNFMDQILPMIYMPLIFFYENDESKPNQNVETSQLLKQSLSQILNIYHPLAGRIEKNLFVDCNDTGVEFIEAQVHASIAQFKEDPKIEELKQLIPVDCLVHGGDDFILSVKISFFDCGGFAIGICLSHKVGDLSSFILFMNAWSAECRGETQIIQPCFDLAVHFPPKDSISSCFTPANEEITTNRLVFDKKMLERLKQEAACGEVQVPTTVEALSVFIWKNFNEATKAMYGVENSLSVLIYAMDLRPRTIPKIPNHSFGNCTISNFVPLTDTSDVLSELRTSMRSIDGGCIKKLSADEYLRTVNEATELFMSGTEPLSFSSWWRFPMYDVDFGWGRPLRVCTTTFPYNNTVYLLSTPSGDGVEAWINMSQDLFQMLKINYNNLLS